MNKFWVDGDGNIYQGERPLDIEVEEISEEEFFERTKPSLDELKTNKISEMKDLSQKAINRFIADTPDFEQKSWPKQEAEARTWQKTPDTPTPYCDIIWRGRGDELETREQFLGKVIYKSDLFAEISATIIGKRQKIEKQIEAAETAEDLADIRWE